MEYLATDLAKKLKISRSYLYYLKDTGEIEVKMTEQGRYLLDDTILRRIQEHIKKNQPKN